MTRDRLRLLYVSQMPPSPPRFGAQVRMHGLMTALAHRHDLTAVTLFDPVADDTSIVRSAMEAYCEHVVLVPIRRATDIKSKRLLQLRSLASRHSFERLVFSVPALQCALDETLTSRRFDIVNVEFPFLAHYRLRGAPPGEPLPALVLDEHNIEHDVLRQVARSDTALDRRFYNLMNAWKLRREEERAWRSVDGVTVCSSTDEAVVLNAIPVSRTAVIPNAVDTSSFVPDTNHRRDGRVILFFGAMHYYPNTDAVLFFLDEIWPRLRSSHPDARLRLVGPRPPPEVLSRQSSCVEVTGFVEDVRPHIAEAAVIIAPIRIGGGTRLKILEAMAMGKAVVSTHVGAEGLAVTPGEHLLLADDPSGFAAAVSRILDDRALADRLGHEARVLIEQQHSWESAAIRLDTFFRELLKSRAERALPAAPQPVR
jgi:glycosyltransferase involved in cell wall biosynthesis